MKTTMWDQILQFAVLESDQFITLDRSDEGLLSGAGIMYTSTMLSGKEMATLMYAHSSQKYHEQ